MSKAPEMNKAFTKESDDAPEELGEEPWPLPEGVKNYMTPSGAEALKLELAEKTSALSAKLEPRERREIERRIRGLERRFAEGEIVDPAAQNMDRVRFGARVTVREEDDSERTYWIVGVDQADPPAGQISFLSAIAKALLGAKVGELVTVRTPSGERDLEIMAIR
jgi:transcription elongation factor GreB